MLITAELCSKFGRNFVGGAIGGLLLELVRIGLAMAITSISEPPPAAFSQSLIDFVRDGSGLELRPPTEVSAWLANFRLFNIPILVGVGFLGGSAAASARPARRGARKR
jgi:hypothetical protein